MTLLEEAPGRDPAPARSEPRLRADAISVRFGGLMALNEVSLDVPAGGIIGLVGPNGAGKSTLFSALSGLRRPTSGRVYLGGVDVTAASAQRRARMGLARTFQQPELFAGLTIGEHLLLADRMRFSHRRLWSDLALGGGFRRQGRDETARVTALLSLLGLDRVGDRLAVGVPLGLARLIEVGRALAARPSVLLLDEPSSGLDAEETEGLADVLRRSVEEHQVAMVLVEHDVEMVFSLCSHVHVIDFGTKISDGPPQVVRADPLVRAAYLGEEPDAAKTGEVDS
jgi:branched-chain amino acid transport system ATP-binding protein